ncbi:MAG: UbiA family prenyltransferase [Verrucomicrobiae bacterium]|nr:UbiA family prenyltransferase [Verrucomicrobiae bacterium]
MQYFFRKIFSYAESQTWSWSRYFFTFLGIIFIRGFLEKFSNPHWSGQFITPLTAFFHYPLFYLSIFLSLNIVLYLFAFSKKSFYPSLKQVFQITLFGFLIIWLPPLVDFAVYHGNGPKMTYLFQPKGELIKSFFSFFGSLSQGGITLGIRIEVVLILIGFFFAITYYTGSKKKAFWGALLVYVLFFFYFAIPSIPPLVFAKVSSTREIMLFYVHALSQSDLSKIYHIGALSFNPRSSMDQQFNLVMGRVLWLLILLQAMGLFYLANKTAFRAWCGNLRLERVLHYGFMGIGGILIAAGYSRMVDLKSWINALSLTVFFLLIALHFWLAVGVNDLVDIKTDTVSNPSRPLIQGSITLQEQKIINGILLFLVIVGVFLLPYYTSVCLILFQMVYYLYSSPPLRLKKVFALSSLLVAFNAILIMMGGFYLVSENQKMAAFPTHLSWLFLICFFLGVNIKDIKDIQGDALEKIQTIPVLFGERRGKIIIGALCVVSFIIVPIVLQNKLLLIIAVPFSCFIYYFINQKSYRENRVFSLYFLYLLAIGVCEKLVKF